MPRICAVRQFPFDTHLQREVNALLWGGHEVEVVCMRRPGEPGRESRGRLTIWRLPVRHKRGGIARYPLEHAAFLSLAVLVVALRYQERSFDVVQVNTPPDSIILSALVPKLLGSAVLMDLVECVPEFFATKFGAAGDHFAVRLLGCIEQLSIRLATHAITGTDQMKNRFVERGADEHRIDVVLNASEETIFKPGPRETLDRDPIPDERFTLISHGSIEPRYGLDTVIRAVSLLREDLPGLRFEIYGEGSDEQSLEALAEDLGVDDKVRFGGFVPASALTAAIRRADAGVVAVKRDAFRDLTHTNKMFDFIAMRRPAIVSWTRAVGAYFDGDSLQFFQSDDPHDLARAIMELYRNPPRRDQLVQNAARLYDTYRWPRQREIYLEVIDRLSGAAASRRVKR